MGTLLTLVVLVPTVGMGLLAFAGASDRWDESQRSSRVHAEAVALEHVMAIRAAISDEWILSAALVSAAEQGLNAAGLADVLGVDVAADLELARENGSLHEYGRQEPELMSELAHVRTAVDAGDTDTMASLNRTFTALSALVERRWDTGMAEVRATVDSSTSLRRAGALRGRIDVLDETFAGLEAVKDLANFANLILLGRASPVNVAGLIEARGRYEEVTSGLVAELGPEAAAAWQAWRSDPSTERAELVVGAAAELVLSAEGVDAPLVPTVYESALTDGIRWINGVTSVITAAAHDLADLALEQQTAAARSVVTQATFTTLLALVALGAGFALSRAVANPLRRLAAFADEVGTGHFELASPPPTGPREVAGTIRAIADMTATVAAVEAFAIELARDPESSALDRPLPGQTGRALQTTVNHLRQSMRADVRQREELEEIATHDGLTGILNRSAALDAIERDLARSRRDGAAFAVLFADLDGLKAINDTHGHETGDRAILLAAEALRASTRRSDIVARIGGDEFIVALRAADAGRAAELAERIHRTMAEQVLVVGRARVRVRCSIGVALADPEDTPDAVIRKADQALYEAKALGRDQVRWFEPEPRAVPV